MGAAGVAAEGCVGRGKCVKESGAVAKRRGQLEHLHALMFRGPGAWEKSRRAFFRALVGGGAPEFQEKLQ